MKKTAIVTGGSRGIGLAIVKKLGLSGYRVVMVAASTQESNRQTLAELDSMGVDCFYQQCDLGELTQHERVLRAAVEYYGDIDVLVNNAGVAPLERVDILDMQSESYDRVNGINTRGTFFFTQRVAKQMLAQPLKYAKRATIVTVSSNSAEVSSTSRAEYCISKAGLSMMSTLFADRLAGDGIFVHEVRPGVIRTDMTSAVQEKYSDLITQGAFPIARWGTPEDVASAVAVLCGDDFLYTTGSCIDVDGGFHIKRL